MWPILCFAFLVTIAVFFRFQSRTRQRNIQKIAPLYREVGAKHFDSDQDKAYQENVEIASKRLAKAFPDLITFNSSPVDMEPWERISTCALLEDEEDMVEINLL